METSGYICGICKASYLTERLKNACESISPEEKVAMELGTVFKRCDISYEDVFSIFYGLGKIEQQTHKRTHLLAAIGDLLGDGELWIVPFEGDKTFIEENALPITDKELGIVKETLEKRLYPVKDSDLEDAKILRDLTLTPFKGFQ